MEIGSKIKVGAFDLKESRDMLEVVRLGNGLHYLYTFMEGGIRRAIDPADGFQGVRKGAPDRKTVIKRYQERGAAIIIG